MDTDDRDHGLTVGPTAPPRAADRETVAAVTGELDALMARFQRLAQAGVVCEDHREVLHTIVAELAQTRGRLTTRSPRIELIAEALGDTAEHVDAQARAHRGCPYSPALTDLAERITAAAEALTP